MKLPPIDQIDPDGMKLGNSSRVELNMHKCKHELYLVSSTEAKCKHCPVGYIGSGIVSLVQASQRDS